MAMLGGFGVSVSDQRHAHIGLLMDQLKTARLHSASYSEEVQLEKLNEIKTFLREHGDKGKQNREYFLSNATGAILELFGLLDEIRLKKREARQQRGYTENDDQESQEDEITLAVLEILIDLLTALEPDVDDKQTKTPQRSSGAALGAAPVHAQAAYRIVQRQEHVQTLIGLLTNDNSWDSLLALQVLVALIKIIPDMLVPQLQECEAGFEAIMQMLWSSEEIRNEALLLMVYLSDLSLHFRQFFMFQDGLTQLFSLIHEQGGASGSVTLQDALRVMCNVLRSVGIGDSNLILVGDTNNSSAVNPVLLSTNNLCQKSFLEFERYKDILPLLQISQNDIESDNTNSGDVWNAISSSSGFGATLHLSNSSGSTQLQADNHWGKDNLEDAIDTGMLSAEKSMSVHYGLSALEAVVDQIPPLMHYIFWKTNCNCTSALRQTSPFKFTTSETEADFFEKWIERGFKEKYDMLIHVQEYLSKATNLPQSIASIAFGPYCSPVYRIRAVNLLSTLTYCNNTAENVLLETPLSKNLNEYLTQFMSQHRALNRMAKEGLLFNVFSASAAIALAASTNKGSSAAERFSVDSVSMETLGSNAWEYVHALRPFSHGDACANFLIKHLRSSEDACIRFIGQTLSPPRVMTSDTDVESPAVLSPGALILQGFFSSTEYLLNLWNEGVFAEDATQHLGVFSFCCRVYETVFMSSRTACEEIGSRLTYGIHTKNGLKNITLLDYLIEKNIELLNLPRCDSDELYVNLDEKQVVAEKDTSPDTCCIPLSSYMVWFMLRILSPWISCSRATIISVCKFEGSINLLSLNAVSDDLTKRAAVAYFLGHLWLLQGPTDMNCPHLKDVINQEDLRSDADTVISAVMFENRVTDLESTLSKFLTDTSIGRRFQDLEESWRFAFTGLTQSLGTNELLASNVLRKFYCPSNSTKQTPVNNVYLSPELFEGSSMLSSALMMQYELDASYMPNTGNVFELATQYVSTLDTTLALRCRLLQNQLSEKAAEQQLSQINALLSSYNVDKESLYSDVLSNDLSAEVLKRLVKELLHIVEQLTVAPKPTNTNNKPNDDSSETLQSMKNEVDFYRRRVRELEADLEALEGTTSSRSQATTSPPMKVEEELRKELKEERNRRHILEEQLNMEKSSQVALRQHRGPCETIECEQSSNTPLDSICSFVSGASKYVNLTESLEECRQGNVSHALSLVQEHLESTNRSCSALSKELEELKTDHEELLVLLASQDFEQEELKKELSALGGDRAVNRAYKRAEEALQQFTESENDLSGAGLNKALEFQDLPVSQHEGQHANSKTPQISVSSKGHNGELAQPQENNSFGNSQNMNSEAEGGNHSPQASTLKSEIIPNEVPFWESLKNGNESMLAGKIECNGSESSKGVAERTDHSSQPITEKADIKNVEAIWGSWDNDDKFMNEQHEEENNGGSALDKLRSTSGKVVDNHSSQPGMYDSETPNVESARQPLNRDTSMDVRYNEENIEGDEGDSPSEVFQDDGDFEEVPLSPEDGEQSENAPGFTQSLWKGLWNLGKTVIDEAADDSPQWESSYDRYDRSVIDATATQEEERYAVDQEGYEGGNTNPDTRDDFTQIQHTVDDKEDTVFDTPGDHKADIFDSMEPEKSVAATFDGSESPFGASTPMNSAANWF